MSDLAGTSTLASFVLNEYFLTKYTITKGTGVSSAHATGTALVISAWGCGRVKFNINIAMPVFWIPVSMAIVKASFADCLNNKAIIPPSTYPSHGKVTDAITI